MFNPTRKIIDAHFHVGTWGTRELFGRKVTPLGPSSHNFYSPGQEHHSYIELLNYLDYYHIESGIVMSNYLADDPRYSLIDLNLKVIEAMDKSDRIYGGLFVSPILQDKDFTEEALKMLPHPRFRVMKFTSTQWNGFTADPNTWSPDVKKMMEKLLAAAKEHNLVLQFHTGGMNSEPLFFDEFLRIYGNELKVHLVHSGESVYPGIQFMTLIREWLDKGYQVYSDTSMVPGFVIKGVIRNLSRDEIKHFMFATDAPWGDFSSEYWKVEGLDIVSSLKERIFYHNAQDLYHIAPL